MERRGPSHLGPYGQACKSCFKSKCKCVARQDGPGCQRCFRLKKSCQPSNPEDRRPARKKESDARVSQLEKKIDGLISRLEARGALDARDGDRTPRRTSQTPTFNQQTPQILDLGAFSPSSGAFTSANEHEGSQLPGEQSIEDDRVNETLLGTFRSRMLPHFPFLDLPPRITAQKLKSQRPLLHRAIVCVTSQNHKRKVTLELRRALSEAFLEEETDKIDLLLALLTYLSWGRDHAHLMSRLMLQAVSLACEINSYPATGGMHAAEVRDIFFPGACRSDSRFASNFVEQHRAVLGCFVLSSAVSTYLDHNIDALRWTPHMAEGLAVLSASHESPSDAAFAVQIRLQLLAEKSVHIWHQQQTEQSGHMQAPARTIPAVAASALLSLATLLEELQGLRASLPATGMDTARYISHAWATELAINQARYAVGSMVPFMVTHFSAMTTNSADGPPKNGERAGYLWQCVHCAKAIIDGLLTLSASDFAGMSLVQWTQLSRGLEALYHLTMTINDPFWDCNAVNSVVDVRQLLDRVAQKLHSAATAVAVKKYGPEDIFSGIAGRMSRLCADLRASCAAREHGANEDARAQSTFHRNVTDLWHIPVSNYDP